MSVRVRLFRGDLARDPQHPERGCWLDVTHAMAGWGFTRREDGQFPHVIRTDILENMGEIGRDIGEELTLPRAGTVEITLCNDPVVTSYRAVDDGMGTLGNPGVPGFFTGMTLSHRIWCLIETYYEDVQNYDQDTPNDNSYMDTVSPHPDIEEPRRLVGFFAGIVDPSSWDADVLIHRETSGDVEVRGCRCQVNGYDYEAGNMDMASVLDAVTGDIFRNVRLADPGDTMPTGFQPGHTDCTGHPLSRATPIHETLFPVMAEEFIRQISPSLLRPDGTPFPMAYSIEMNAVTLVGLHFQLLEDNDFQPVQTFCFLYFEQTTLNWGIFVIGYRTPTGTFVQKRGNWQVGWVTIDVPGVYDGAGRFQFINSMSADVSPETLAGALGGVILYPPPIVNAQAFGTFDGREWDYISTCYSWHYGLTQEDVLLALIYSTNGNYVWSVRVVKMTWNGTSFGAPTTVVVIEGDANDYSWQGDLSIHHLLPRANAYDYIRDRHYYVAFDNRGSIPALVLFVYDSAGAHLGPTADSLGYVAIWTVADENTGILSAEHLARMDWLCIHQANSVTLIQCQDDTSTFFTIIAIGFRPTQTRGDTETTMDILPQSFLCVPYIGDRRALSGNIMVAALCRDGNNIWLWTCPTTNVGLRLDKQQFYLVTDEYTEGQLYDLTWSSESGETDYFGALYGYAGSTVFRLSPRAGFVTARFPGAEHSFQWGFEEVAKTIFGHCAFEFEAMDVGRGPEPGLMIRLRQHDFTGYAPAVQIDAAGDDMLMISEGSNRPHYQLLHQFCVSGVEVQHLGGNSRAVDASGNERGDYSMGAKIMTINAELIQSWTIAEWLAGKHMDLVGVPRYGWGTDILLTRWRLLDRVQIAGMTCAILSDSQDPLRFRGRLELIEIPAPTTAPDCHKIAWDIATATVIAYGLQGIQDEWPTYSATLPCSTDCANEWYFLLLAMAENSETGPWNQSDYSILLDNLVNCVRANCPETCAGEPNQIA